MLIALASLALIAAGVAWWLLRDDGPTVRDPAGRPKQEDPVSLISSKGVEKNISQRLTARAGGEVDVVCPPKVATIAKVTITGGGGAFTWTSENAPTPEPAASGE